MKIKPQLPPKPVRMTAPKPGIHPPPSPPPSASLQSALPSLFPCSPITPAASAAVTLPLPPPPPIPTAPLVSSLSSGDGRKRGASVSFAQSTYSADKDKERLPPPKDVLASEARPTSQPQSMSDTFCLSDMDITRYSLKTAASHANASLSPSQSIFADSVVDPTILVLAQTNTGNSLAPPSADPSSNSVPMIPAPPLLLQHRILQQQLDSVMETLSDYKAKRTALLSTTPHGTRTFNDLERTINDQILQQTTRLAEKREILNKVRTLYMSAATVPSIMQFPPHLIAYQITLIEYAIFKAISPEALVTHSPKTPHSSIVASTDFFNYLTRAIEHSILLPQEASQRALVLNRWIKVASRCLDLHNYQTLKAIVSALNTPPVARLHRTWDCIPKKHMQKLELIHLLMSEANNYERYRDHIHIHIHTTRHSPCSVVPFLGLFLHDMTYLLAVKGTRRTSRVQTLIHGFKVFQSTPQYPLCPPDAFVKVKRRHPFRPTVITQALNRTSKQKTWLQEQGKEGEEEQQLMTQYLLMRSWVTQPIIDELSQLREPPKPRTVCHQRTASQTSSSALSTHSLFSNHSSLSRFPSMGGEEDTKKNSSGGFWRFRRGDIRQSESERSSWSEDEEEEEEEEEEDEEEEDKREEGLAPSSHSPPTSYKSTSRHLRSLSLPLAIPKPLGRL
ncbi:ras guanine nucleotide exchange factor domain-containing protein [Spinellus fusiger]|nr:ras guanine nucleotide exchange factor domain-containing protein [Spinellus fusiger]